MTYLIGAIIALCVAAAEAVSYSGFTLSHIGVPAYIFYIGSIALSFFYKKTVKSHKVLYPIGIFVAVIYLILIFLETITYPNFVFTRTHINPITFQFLVGLFWFHILTIGKFNQAKSLLIAGLIFVGVDGAGRTLGYMYKNMWNMVSNPLATYDQKMTKVYPGFYPAIQQVKKLTPTDSAILIPPQGNPWEIEGNAAMVTYFLYPRHVQNLNPENISSLPPNTFILIAHGSWPRTGEVDYGWPKVPVKAVKIWHIDTTSNTTKQYNKDYDPTLDKWDWGLIEVKNE